MAGGSIRRSHTDNRSFSLPILDMLRVRNSEGPIACISGGGPTKFKSNRKTIRSKPQVDLTSAPPIHHHLGNDHKQPKSRHYQVRTSKSESLPNSTTALDGISTRPINSAPQAGNTDKVPEQRQPPPPRHFPKINTFVQENVYGLTTAQLAYREMPDGKNWATHLAGFHETNKYLRADGSNDKLALRKQRPEKSHLEIITRPQTLQTEQTTTDKNDSGKNKNVHKLDLSKISSKVDTGKTVTKVDDDTPRSSVYSYDHTLKKRIITTIAARRLNWKKFRRKNIKQSQIFSQKNVKTERKLQGVYANNEYKIQRQARVLKRVEDVQYNQVQDYNQDVTQREYQRKHSILTQRENLKLLRDRFDAEQVKRFNNQYVSWKSVETDRLAKGSDAFGLPNNIYADRYSKELQLVTAKPLRKKTFTAMATRVRNIQRFRLILNPKTTSDPDKVSKGSDKLLVEGIDTVQLPQTDGNRHKHKKPTKVRAVIGSAKRLLSTNNIDAIDELSEGEWDDLSSLDISDNEEI